MIFHIFLCNVMVLDTPGMTIETDFRSKSDLFLKIVFLTFFHEKNWRFFLHFSMLPNSFFTCFHVILWCWTRLEWCLKLISLENFEIFENWFFDYFFDPKKCQFLNLKPPFSDIRSEKGVCEALWSDLNDDWNIFSFKNLKFLRKYFSSIF